MRFHAVWLCWLIASLGCSTASDQGEVLARASALAGDDIADRLRALPGLVDLAEVDEGPAGERRFTFQITQPIDHHDARRGRFTLRVQLLHRSETAPTVLSSTGYYLFSARPSDNELSALLNGNAITVEHRFFADSTPLRAASEELPSEDAWQYLDIEQAAADNHRVVQLLRRVYPGAWLSTGASKGGMTSVYHRRFYPDDVQGTVAYVAPHSYGTDDPRYVAFLEQVGDAACRERVTALERDLLSRRSEFLPGFQSRADALEVTFDWIGVDVAFEHFAQEFRFSFWQYGLAGDCANIPEPGAAPDSVFDFITQFLPVDFASDQDTRSVDTFATYYYQAATELGSYGPLEEHLEDLLQFPGSYSVDYYALPIPGRSFDPAPMLDVGDWVKNESEQILFVYGGNDPWGAGAFAIGEGRDVHKLVVPGGNHGASLTDPLLPAADRQTAFELLQAWTGVAPAVPAASLQGTSAERSFAHLPPRKLRL